MTDDVRTLDVPVADERGLWTSLKLEFRHHAPSGDWGAEVPEWVASFKQPESLPDAWGWHMAITGPTVETRKRYIIGWTEKASTDARQ